MKALLTLLLLFVIFYMLVDARGSGSHGGGGHSGGGRGGGRGGGGRGGGSSHSGKFSFSQLLEVADEVEEAAVAVVGAEDAAEVSSFS